MQLRNWFMAAVLIATPLAHAGNTLLNVSYDVSSAFCKDFNRAFASDWKAKPGEIIKIEQSHGGSLKQSRSVIDGLQADVVTLNSSLDIDAIADNAGLLPRDWAKSFACQSAASCGAILFVVRRGNPKGIKDWDDLVKPGVKVVIANPKTSGNGRYSYLGAWEYAKRKSGDAAAREFVAKLFANVPVLDTGGSGATATFAQRNVGDVLLTFENEVKLIKNELGAKKFDVVIPSRTARADNPVAVMSKVAAKHGNEMLARAYLEYHYSDAGQALLEKSDLRPINETVLREYSATLPPLNLFTVDQTFGSWPVAQKTHFADGGVFDQIIAKGR